MLPHERASIDLTCIAMLVNRQVLTLAMPHLSQLRAVLLDRSRSVPKCFPAFPLSQPGCHMPPTPTQRFFGADASGGLLLSAGWEPHTPEAVQPAVFASRWRDHPR